MLSFHTFDAHTDYVRAMAISKQRGMLFSVSDDGSFLMTDLNEGKIVEEYKAVQSYPSTVPALAEFKLEESDQPIFRHLASPNAKNFMSEASLYKQNQACATCIAASDSGNFVVIGHSDDSLVLHDARTKYSERI